MREESKGAKFLEERTSSFHSLDGSESLAKNADLTAKTRAEIAASIPEWESWREKAASIKKEALLNSKRLIKEFETKISAKGAEVLYAKDAEEASKLVIAIAEQNSANKAVKAKSMVSEEIGLNDSLKKAGINAVETDLGEYIVQLADQRPTHIVMPALHLSAEEVGNLFSEKLGEPFSSEHEHLTGVARKHLRKEFLSAGIGLSGANFAVADTGTLTIIENEGNIGLSTSLPPVHVAIVGMEKIIPRFNDLPTFLNLLPRSATCQKITSYVHMIHGATEGQKLHVIILDNGRSKILEDEKTRESLSCIRCGGCLNVCPVYQRVGGWAYGWIYPGPMGSMITPQLVGEKADCLPFASSLCGACRDVCPVKINIPEQLLYLRSRAAKRKTPKRFIERIVWKLWAWTMSSDDRYRIASVFAKFFLRFKFLPPWTNDRSVDGMIESSKDGSFRDWQRGRQR